MVIPVELKKRYSYTTHYKGEFGCIDTDEADECNLNVPVYFDEKDEEDDTLLETCKRGGPEECDEDCQEYFPEWTWAPTAAPSLL